MAEELSLGNLARGAAIERFDAELQKLMDNILDPNTGNGKRTLTLTVVFTPTEDRSTAKVDIRTAVKLAPMASYPSLVFIRKDKHGNALAFENIPEQMGMFDEEDKVINIQDRKDAQGQ